MTALQPLNGLMMLLMDTARLPFYGVHDAMKTVTIPFAAVYYATKDSPAQPKPAKAKSQPDTNKQPEANRE